MKTRFTPHLVDLTFVSAEQCGLAFEEFGATGPAAASQAMCRHTLSVSWDGHLYDCDFNQMIELPVASDLPRHVDGFDASALHTRRIVTGDHCYGCTAGSGSSCGGATTT